MTTQQPVQTPAQNSVQNPLLDPQIGATVYHNFLKITKWVVMGNTDEAPFPPNSYLAVMTANAETLRQTVQQLQGELISKDQRIAAVEAKCAVLETALNQVLKNLNTPPQPVAEMPVAETPAPTPTQAPSVTAPTQTVAVQVEAGELTPQSWAELDAQLAELMQ